MLFMLVSRAKPGMKREELVERFTGPLRLETWDLIRSGELSQVFYKVGDEPGFFAILGAFPLCRQALRRCGTHQPGTRAAKPVARACVGISAHCYYPAQQNGAPRSPERSA